MNNIKNTLIVALLIFIAPVAIAANIKVVPYQLLANLDSDAAGTIGDTMQLLASIGGVRAKSVGKRELIFSIA